MRYAATADEVPLPSGSDRAPTFVGKEEVHGPDRVGRSAWGGVRAGSDLLVVVAGDDERADQDREHHDQSGADSQWGAASPVGSRGLLSHTYQEATTQPGLVTSGSSLPRRLRWADGDERHRRSILR